MARAIDSPHAALSEQRFHLILTVEHSVDDRRGIGFEYLPIDRTEAHAVIVFCFAGRAVFHFGGSSLTQENALDRG